jgi:hypothetical protein
MSNCPDCIFFASECTPPEADYKKECAVFTECGDKQWAMRNGLWDIEDEINDMEEPDDHSNV